MIRLFVNNTDNDPATVAAFVQSYLQSNLDPKITCQGIADPFDALQEDLDFGDIVLNRGLVLYRDQSIELSPRRFTLLYYLLVNRGRICPHRSISQYIWPKDDYILTDSVKKLIQNLRRSLDPYTGPDFIRTIHGIGYVINRSS